ncbi:hypothetical protein ZWY2020_024739 [Hordeum vulgare]|nr:hypothetical protein ZWY2020_024739 [Hordeum vulgare]
MNVTPGAPPALPNVSPPAGEEGEARVVTSQTLVVEPPEPPKHPEATASAPLPEGKALGGPQSTDVPMLAISEQPSEPPVLRDDASQTAPPAAALEAPQEEILKTSVFTHGVLNNAIAALGKVVVAMAQGEKEAKAARTAREEALEETASARAAHEEAMKEAAAAATCCEGAEARLKALQEEQAEQAGRLCLREEQIEARPTKLATQEEKLSQDETQLGAKQVRLDKQEKEIALKKALLDANRGAHAAADALCQDGLDEPLATPEDGFAVLAAELAVALEDAVVQVDKVFDSECQDLFTEAATCVFSHLHLREPGV